MFGRVHVDINIGRSYLDTIQVGHCLTFVLDRASLFHLPHVDKGMSVLW